MRDRTRRLELGKMLMDVAKYVLTILVIGGFFYKQVGPFVAVLGFVLAMIFLSIGFQIIPPEEEKR
jgi:polyferredoxin